MCAPSAAIVVSQRDDQVEVPESGCQVEPPSVESSTCASPLVTSLDVPVRVRLPRTQPEAGGAYVKTEDGATVSTLAERVSVTM